jgi:signal transduction histidine kinase
MLPLLKKKWTVSTKMGEQRWLQSSIHLMPEKKNSPPTLLYYFHRHYERKKLEAELLLQQKKNNGRSTGSAGKGTCLVGQELHDNVNQVLTTIKLYNEICLDDVAKNQVLLQKSVQMLQTTINEIRSLSKRLSAPSLGQDEIVRIRKGIDAVGSCYRPDCSIVRSQWY